MSAEERFSELHRVAQAAGRLVAAQHAGYVTAEDMTQEAILWLLEHPERVDNHTLPSGELHFKQLVGEVVTRRLSKVAQRERDESAGGSPEDRYAYSVRVVELVLPAVFEEQAPKAISYGQVYSTSDPAESGNFNALVIDVRTAIAAVCSSEDRKVLFTRALGGWTWAKFGDVLELSGETYRQRYWDALRRIVAYLNDGLVLDHSLDADVLEVALEDVPTSPYLAGDPDEDDWRTIGRDPYKEPDL